MTMTFNGERPYSVVTDPSLLLVAFASAATVHATRRALNSRLVTFKQRVSSKIFPALTFAPLALATAGCATSDQTAKDYYREPVTQQMNIGHNNSQAQGQFVSVAFSVPKANFLPNLKAGADQESVNDIADTLSLQSQENLSVCIDSSLQSQFYKDVALRDTNAAKGALVAMSASCVSQIHAQELAQLKMHHVRKHSAEMVAAQNAAHDQRSKEMSALAAIFNTIPSSAKEQIIVKNVIQEVMDKPAVYGKNNTQMAKNILNKALEASRTAVLDLRTGTLTLPDGESFKAASGNGYGKNNPGMQSVANQGPIPMGKWNVDVVQAHTFKLQNGKTDTTPAMQLLPAGNTQTFGRDGFFVHHNHSTKGIQTNGCVGLMDGDMKQVITARQGYVFDRIEVTYTNNVRPKTNTRYAQSASHLKA